MGQFGREYFKLSPELLCVFDFDGNFIELNPSWKKTLGWETHEFLQSSFINFIHPDDKEKSMNEFKKLFTLKDHAVFNFENRYRHLDGSYRWLQWTGSLIESEKQVCCSARDITYLKGLESEKTLLNDRFKLVLAAIKFGVWDMTIEGNILVWDESMYDLFGVNKKDFSGTFEAWQAALHPDDKEKSVATFMASINDNVDFDTTFRIITNKKEIRHIAAKGYVERDSSGKGVRITGINWDITKKVEQEKIFETIVNNIPIMITFLNPDGSVEWINPHWTECLGWGIEDFKGGFKDRPIFINKKDEHESIEFMKDAPPEWREFPLHHKDGGIAHTIWTNVKLSDGKVIGIGQDIGEKKMQEELIKDQQARMISSAKLSSLGEMASGIAHEINNPLAIIKGKAYQILKKLEAGEADVDFLSKEITKIEQNSLRIVKIIKGLRTFSRHGDNDPYQIVPFKVILDDVLELCQERFKHQGVEFKTKGDLSRPILCQETQLAQVVLNLMNNAHDAVVNSSNPWVEVEVEANELAISIFVTDSGPGISEEVAQKIMQPFFTTKDVGTGTGLGLSISKGIVEMHGGSLFLDRYCPNTRFVIQLPPIKKFS